MTLLAPVVVSRIEPERAWVQPCEYDPEHPMGSRPMGEAYPVEARFVFSLLGHRGDLSLIKRLGLCLNADGRARNQAKIRLMPLGNGMRHGHGVCSDTGAVGLMPPW